MARLLTPVPKDADSTKEFKQSLRLENGLRAKMNVIVNAVKRTNTMSDHQRQMMRDAIRNSVQRVWVVGAQYAANFLNRDFIMTQTDIENIKDLSNEFADRMSWRIENYILNRSENKDPISTDFITNTFAGYVAPRTLSVAVREKTRQLLLPTTTTSSPTIGIGIGIGIASAEAAAAAPAFPYESPFEFNAIFVWVTANDDRVCPVCFGLEGSRWDVHDPDVPEPDTDTHPNCRCMLRLVEAEFQ